jgi:hypothetical protein
MQKIYDETFDPEAEEPLGKFQAILNDFTSNFNKYFFTKEYAKNLMWNLCFEGFFYCPIDRKTFL